MPRVARTLVVLVLAALLPLRAVAGVTMGFCANGHQEAAASETAPSHHHGHGGDHARSGGHQANGDLAAHAAHGAQVAQGGDGSPAHPSAPTCSICVEHCSSAAFAPVAAAPGLAAPAVSEASAGVAVTAAPAFVPDQLDRPPLA